MPSKDISADALEILGKYRWPGNVRELENLVKRLMAMEVDDVVGANAVLGELAGPPPQATTEKPAGALPDTINEYMEQHLAGYMSAFGDKLPPDGLYDRVLNQVEPPLIRAVLAATRGNQLKAAEVLGINRNTLRVKIKVHHIKALRGFS